MIQDRLDDDIAQVLVGSECIGHASKLGATLSPILLEQVLGFYKLHLR